MKEVTQRTNHTCIPPRRRDEPTNKGKEKRDGNDGRVRHRTSNLGNLFVVVCQHRALESNSLGNKTYINMKPQFGAWVKHNDTYVSHMVILTRLPATEIALETKSTPIVDCSGSNASLVNRNNKEDFPTPELPTRRTLNASSNSLIAKRRRVATRFLRPWTKRNLDSKSKSQKSSGRLDGYHPSESPRKRKQTGTPQGISSTYSAIFQLPSAADPTQNRINACPRRSNAEISSAWKIWRLDFGKVSRLVWLCGNWPSIADVIAGNLETASVCVLIGRWLGSFSHVGYFPARLTKRQVVAATGRSKRVLMKVSYISVLVEYGSSGIVLLQGCEATKL